MYLNTYILMGFYFLIGTLIVINNSIAYDLTFSLDTVNNIISIKQLQKVIRHHVMSNLDFYHLLYSLTIIIGRYINKVSLTELKMYSVKK